VTDSAEDPGSETLVVAVTDSAEGPSVAADTDSVAGSYIADASLF